MLAASIQKTDWVNIVSGLDVHCCVYVGKLSLLIHPWALALACRQPAWSGGHLWKPSWTSLSWVPHGSMKALILDPAKQRRKSGGLREKRAPTMVLRSSWVCSGQKNPCYVKNTKTFFSLLSALIILYKATETQAPQVFFQLFVAVRIL